MRSNFGALAQKLGSTGLLEVNIGSDGITAQLGMAGIDVGGAVYNLGKRLSDKAALEKYEAQNSEEGSVAMNAYIHGEWAQENTAARLARGKDELVFSDGSGKKEGWTAQTTQNGKGGRIIEMRDAGNVNNNAIQLGHEAYRDGYESGDIRPDGTIVTQAGNVAETAQAVRGHTEMAARMLANDIDLDLSGWIGSDITAYKMAMTAGNMNLFDNYTDELYSSEADLLKFDFLNKDTKFANWSNKAIDSVIAEKQEIINNAELNAKNEEELSKKEQQTLKTVYDLIIMGGQLMGYNEAADLLGIYLNPKKASQFNEDNPYQLNSKVYEESAIVQYASEEMKKYIFNTYSSENTDKKTVNSSDVLKSTPERNSNTEGHVLPDGNLIAEQNNQQLKNTDNRFPLKADIIPNKNGDLIITWTVDSKWDYEPYPGTNYTLLPFNKDKNQVLKLDDGLSAYLTKIGMAKDFYYHAQWKETLCIPKK